MTTILDMMREHKGALDSADKVLEEGRRIRRELTDAYGQEYVMPDEILKPLSTVFARQILLGTDDEKVEATMLAMELSYRAGLSAFRQEGRHDS